MSTAQIYADLRSRGERCIQYHEQTDTWISEHGKHTVNYWKVKNNELICVDCKTTA